MKRWAPSCVAVAALVSGCDGEPHLTLREPAIVLEELYRYPDGVGYSRWIDARAWLPDPHGSGILDSFHAFRNDRDGSCVEEDYGADLRDPVDLNWYGFVEDCDRLESNLGVIRVDGLGLGPLVFDRFFDPNVCGGASFYAAYVEREGIPTPSTLSSCSTTSDLCLPLWSRDEPFFVPGGSVSVAGAGGPDAPAFAVDLSPPEPLILTSPSVVPGTPTWFADGSWDPSAELLWIPGNGVYVLIHAGAFEDGETGQYRKRVRCLSDDDGVFRFPAGWRNRLEEAVTWRERWYVTVTRVVASPEVDLGLVHPTTGEKLPALIVYGSFSLSLSG